MPSRGNMYLIPGATEFKITPCQVEDLVCEIKENLRLSASPRKSKQTFARKTARASPYKVPIRCDKQCEGTGCLDCMRKRRCLGKCGVQEQEESDPYEVLQQLLRDGNLIQEAVRRVQLGLSPKQRYFYSDSEAEDDLRSPVKRYHDTTSVKETTRC